MDREDLGHKNKALSIFLLAILMVSSISTPLVFADGADSPAACEGGPTTTTSGNTVIAAGVGNIITSICIKSGNNSFGLGITHSQLITNTNTDTYGTAATGGQNPTITATDACYLVSGIGTQTVSVTETGTANCKGISHVDYFIGSAPPPPPTCVPGDVCRLGSGDICDPAEICDSLGQCPADVVASAGTVCRGTADVCDVAEACDGTGAACPADGFVTAGTVCNPGSGDVCDPDESCTGSSAACPSDTFDAGTTVCNPGSGDVCDPDELCPGVADAACPAGSTNLAAPGTVCNPGSGDVCDPDEVCSGTEDTTCPSDTFDAGTTVCNPGSGDVCDPDELCPGVADAACPADTVAGAGTVCDPSDGTCDPQEVCTGVTDEACPVGTENICISRTQGGYGSPPNGNNPGQILKNNFNTVFPSPNYLKVGGNANRCIQLTTSNAVDTFLPTGSTAGAINNVACYVNPAAKFSTGAGVLAGQVITLKINVALSGVAYPAGYAGLEVCDAASPFYQQTVAQLLATAEQKLQNLGSASFSDVNTAVTKANEALDGTNTGYLGYC